MFLKYIYNISQEGKYYHFVFSKVRRHVYHDADNLDTAFDAGGKVSIGLTATTIVSQWTWSATLLQSSTVASKVSENILVILGENLFRPITDINRKLRNYPILETIYYRY